MEVNKYPKYEDIYDVSLVSYTKPAVVIEWQGVKNLKDLVAYQARVSNPSGQNKSADKLIDYLIAHKHWSPFEMVDVTFEIYTTRDISRQILRHKSANFQEFSQRYADPTKELEFCLREPRLQDAKNRQNSIAVESDGSLTSDWYECQEMVINIAIEMYKGAIDRGIAKECARVILPEGNTMTRMYMKNSIRGWIHYLEVRTGVETQLEHRMVAQKIATLLGEIF